VQEEQAAEAASVVLLPWNTLVFRRKPGQVDNTSSEQCRMHIVMGTRCSNAGKSALTMI
jgi:hypothetical protein